MNSRAKDGTGVGYLKVRFDQDPVAGVSDESGGQDLGAPSIKESSRQQTVVVPRTAGAHAKPSARIHNKRERVSKELLDTNHQKTSSENVVSNDTIVCCVASGLVKDSARSLPAIISKSKDHRYDGNYRKQMASRIASLRRSRNVSKTDFAKLLGVSRPTVYELESGARRLFADELLLISKTFNVNLSWLLGDLPNHPDE